MCNCSVVCYLSANSVETMLATDASTKSLFARHRLSQLPPKGLDLATSRASSLLKTSFCFFFSSIVPYSFCSCHVHWTHWQAFPRSLGIYFVPTKTVVHCIVFALNASFFVSSFFPDHFHVLPFLVRGFILCRYSFHQCSYHVVPVRLMPVAIQFDS